MSVTKSSLTKYASLCLNKFESNTWKSKDIYFTTDSYTAFSHDGINWSREVDDNERVWVTTGKNSKPILKKKSGELDTYCGITTFLYNN
jgi:hypothetical protein